MATSIWVNIGSGIGLVPDGTKPIPEPVLLLNNEVLWHSPESYFTMSAQGTIMYNKFKNYTLKIRKT